MKFSDPFEENEAFAAMPLPSQYDNKSNFRFTKTMCVITGMDSAEIRFIRGKDFSVKIGFSEHVEITSKGKTKSKKCDMGHFHDVPTTEHFAYVVEKLSRKESVMLGKWLISGERPDE